MSDAADRSPPARGKNRRRWLLQAVVSFAVLGALFWLLPTGEIIDGIARVPIPLFLAICLAFLGIHLAASIKWWLLIGRVIPAATALRAHLIGLTANLCLPGVAGGDAARIAVAWKPATDRSRLVAGSLSDRLIDMMALGLIALAGLLLSGAEHSGLALRALPVAIAVFVLGLWVGPPILLRLWAAVPRLPAQSFVRSACKAVTEITRRPLFLAATLSLSVAIQLALMLAALQLARATGVEVAVSAWIFAWALAKLIVVLPVSLGGLGVREALLAALLAPFGAGAAEVVAGGLAWQAVLFVSGSVGGILLIASGRRAIQRMGAQGPGFKEGQGPSTSL